MRARSDFEISTSCSTSSVLIPKRSSTDFRPIGGTCMIARCLEKMLLRRYKSWITEVHCTDALQVLFGVEDAIARATCQGSPLLISQSDLSNCFTRLDAALAADLAKAFGMRPKHANLFLASTCGVELLLELAQLQGIGKPGSWASTGRSHLATRSRFVRCGSQSRLGQ